MPMKQAGGILPQDLGHQKAVLYRLTYASSSRHRGAEPPRRGRFRAHGFPGAERKENQVLDGRISTARIVRHGQDETIA